MDVAHRDEIIEHDIVRKLRAELERGISTESQVVYVLVKIRRLLDLDQDSASTSGYSALRLCCNWAVHAKLSHSQAHNIVRLVDSLYPNLLSGKSTDQEKNDLRKIFSLNTFRGELTQFLSDKRLPMLPDAEWNSFLTCFLNTIEDCPLVCEANGANVTEVDEVVLIKDIGDSDRIPDGKPPAVIWALSFQGQHKSAIGANFSMSDQTVEALIEFGRRRKRLAASVSPDL
jgi:hypothetical protein